EILKKEFSGSCIDRVEQFERRALAWKLEEELFTLTELRPFEWNPLWYDTQLEIDFLFERDFAPLDVRVRSAMMRMRGIGAALAIARQNLLTHLDRTILEISLTVFEGRLEQYDKLLERYCSSLKGTTLYQEFEEVVMDAHMALSNFIAAVKHVVLPIAKYD